MADIGGIGYIKRDSPIHRLDGAAKILMVLFLSLASMLTFDTRFIIFMIIASLTMFFLGRVSLSELKYVLLFILVFMLLNNLMIYLFSPEEGVVIYGTRHELFRINERYTITQEQLFYQLNVTLKYFCILPVSLIFFSTTNPSDFAASLNKIGVSYKISYSVALALRYIPDVKRNYHEISQAQQARGIDMSKKVKLTRRIKNACAILFPLIFSSMDKIEMISNAMELRSFGKYRKRTWYQANAFKKADYFIISISFLCVVIAVILNFVNGGRFYNPFI